MLTELPRHGLTFGISYAPSAPVAISTFASPR